MKKLLSVVLCVLMLAALLPLDLHTASADTSGQCGDNLYWSFDEDTGTLTITGSGDMWNYDSYNDTPWTDDRNDIDIISLPDGLTYIGNIAFSGCTGLQSITIPDSVTSIGIDAFYRCAGLMQITIPEGVTDIGSGAFADCTGLSSITIPESVTRIGSHAFYGCTGLIDITVEEGNQVYCSIDGVLFDKYQTALIQFPCGRSGAYSIPEDVTYIFDCSFYGCTGLTSVTIPDSMTNIEVYAFSDCTGLQSVMIPNSITYIGSNAFDNCTSLTDVYYGGTEEQKEQIEIGENNDPLLNATWYCTEDRYLEINRTNFPDDNFQQWVIENLPVSGNEIDGYYMTEAQVAGVTEIECGNGEVASLCGIEHFTNLETLYCDPFTFSMSGAITSVDLSANTKLKVVDLSCHPLNAIDVTMLPDLEELAVGFTNVSTLDVTKNTKLARLTINATGLSTIDLSQNPLLDWLDLCDAPIQKLDISGCPNMMAYYRAGERHLDLPYLQGKHVYGPGNEDVQYNLAFSDGTTVLTVALTAYARCGETEIGSVAVSPEGIIFPGEQFTLTAPEVEGYTFLGWYRNGSEQMLSDELVYTTSTREEEISFVAAYQENTTDGGPCGEQGGDNVYWVYDKTTYTLTIAGNGKVEANSAEPPWYKYVYDIRKIVVEDGVTSVPGGLFCDARELTSVELGKDVSELKWNPFAWCDKLASIVVDPGNETFRTVDGVLITADGKRIVAYPAQLEGSSYAIPDGVTEIGANAFCTAKNLTSVTIPDSVTAIDGYAFAQSGLTSVTVPASVENVWGGAFEACAALETVVIEGSTTGFGYNDGAEEEGAFIDCSNLRSLTIPCDQHPYERTFAGCYSLEELHLTAGSGEINVSLIGDLLFWYRYTEYWYWDEEAQDWVEGPLPDPKPMSLILDEGIAAIPAGAFDCNYEEEDDFEGNSAIASVTLPLSVIEIGENAFIHCGNLTDVWYNGTPSQKEQIAVAAGNEDLLNAEWHCLPEPFKGTIEWNAEDVAFKDGTPYVIADGTAKTPRFTVKDEDGKVVDPANYDCEYKDNIEPGTASVIVTFKGEYAGTCSGTFEILSPTEVVTQPKAQTVANGKTAKFTVAALGKGVKYQWYYSTNNGTKWTKWSGKTSASVSVTGSAKTNGNLYRCEITKGDYRSTSKSAKLTVSGVKPRITAQPKKTTVAVGETATFKVVAAGTGLKYQWYYSKDNGAKWVKWSGKTKASVNVTASAANNGTMYRCVVKNTKGSVTSSAVKMTVSGVKPRILTQPKAVTVKSGKTVKFTVAAAGVGLKYQWQYSKNGGKTWTKLSGKTSATLSLKAAKKNNGWLYRCVVKNDIGSVNSKGVKLTVK